MRIGTLRMKLRLGCWFLLATLCLLSPCVVAQSPVPAPSDSLLEARWAASTERMEDTVLGLDFRSLLVQRFVAARRIDIPLPKLQGMGDVLSEDGRVRMITWGHPMPLREWHYIGLLVHEFSKDSLQLYPLHDARIPVGDGLIDQELFSQQRTPDDWFGSACYALVPFEQRGQRAYLLLGVAGGNLLVMRRIIEVLSFDDQGRPVFGTPALRHGRDLFGRMLFSHSARVAMTIHPIEKGKRILIDHLSPSRPQFAGMPQYYGPDFSQDVLELQRDGTWLFKSDELVIPPPKASNK